MQTFGTLTLQPALDHPDLLGDPVREALASWEHAGEVRVAEIDPELADTAAMTEAYDVPLEASANCVVVMGRRGGEERTAACVVRADTRADVNNVGQAHPRRAQVLLPRPRPGGGGDRDGVRRDHPDRHPRGLATARRRARSRRSSIAIIGSGIRGSKLFLPGRLLGLLPGAEVDHRSGALDPIHVACHRPVTRAGLGFEILEAGDEFWSIPGSVSGKNPMAPRGAHLMEWTHASSNRRQAHRPSHQVDRARLLDHRRRRSSAASRAS